MAFCLKQRRPQITFLIEMFSGHAHLKRRTPEGGIPRPDYIEYLVEEYHTSTNVEAKEQVTANLANFAYDPINWEYLKEAGALEVFEECTKSPNERLQLHALAGYCNICLDPAAFNFLTKPEVNSQVKLLLQTSEATDLHLNSIALFYQLITADNCSQEEKSRVITPHLLKTITNLRNLSPDPRVKNLAALFCEDFGSRIEEVVDSKNVLESSKKV
ncbi:armadillo repeat-containing protein 7 isoform X1 [Rhagoletis pomonella]|uniref:armadillo repeat-containing protein 7 isoform X1 n=1 Tax=Rhagoletis pomonella TaxID=28610 RepID=UPI001786B070|nr:armadillo repeat-containing protein 7 isoform X1 [Rhagoletis pomonella]